MTDAWDLLRSGCQDCSRCRQPPVSDSRSIFNAAPGGLDHAGNNSVRGVTWANAAAKRLADRGWRPARPLSIASTAALATSSAVDPHDLGQRRLGVLLGESGALAEAGVDRAGHSVVAVTPEPRSSPARLWV